jgi:hypothetical protein
MAGDLISTAAIVLGFGVTVVMFRVQRELYVLETLKRTPVWLAWADYLVLASIFLALIGVIIPLLMIPAPSDRLISMTAGLCVVLQTGFIPAVLAHYRIELGAHRQGPRQKGEPIERIVVLITAAAAVLALAGTLLLRGF